MLLEALLGASVLVNLYLAYLLNKVVINTFVRKAEQEVLAEVGDLKLKFTQDKAVIQKDQATVTNVVNQVEKTVAPVVSAVETAAAEVKTETK